MSITISYYRLTKSSSLRIVFQLFIAVTGVVLRQNCSKTESNAPGLQNNTQDVVATNIFINPNICNVDTKKVARQQFSGCLFGFFFNKVS